MITSCTWLSRKPAPEMRINRAFCCSSAIESAAHIAHAGAKAAHQLKDHRFERSAIRNAAFDAFRHKFRQAVLVSERSR
jgi:hypothetical protein